MDLGSLRRLAVALNFDAHGVPATVTPPDQAPIPTRAIWLTPDQVDEPPGAAWTRREPRRLVALPRAEVPAAPRGTQIAATEQNGGAVESWVVDGTDRIELEHVRVFVVKA